MGDLEIRLGDLHMAVGLGWHKAHAGLFQLRLIKYDAGHLYLQAQVDQYKCDIPDVNEDCPDFDHIFWISDFQAFLKKISFAYETPRGIIKFQVGEYGFTCVNGPGSGTELPTVSGYDY